jgi:DNA-binding IscR family transcriptional regulator
MMLNRLLELLRAGGTHRVADLARELETTPQLVEAMLENLTRMGYLQPMGGECGAGCAGCQLARVCAAGDPSTSLGTGDGRVWALADK